MCWSQQSPPLAHDDAAVPRASLLRPPQFWALCGAMRYNNSLRVLSWSGALLSLPPSPWSVLPTPLHPHSLTSSLPPTGCDLSPLSISYLISCLLKNRSVTELQLAGCLFPLGTQMVAFISPCSCLCALQDCLSAVAPCWATICQKMRPCSRFTWNGAQVSLVFSISCFSFLLFSSCERNLFSVRFLPLRL